MKKAIILILVAVCLVMAQQPGAQPQTQDFIEPVVLNEDNHIPAQMNEQQQPIMDGNQQIPKPNMNPKEIIQNAKNKLKKPQLNQNGQTNSPNTNNDNLGSPPITQQQKAQSRQKADKAKQMAMQARQQADRDRKQRQAKEDQQIRNIQLDGTLSKTQKKKQQQRLKFRKVSRQVQSGTRFTEYLFQQIAGSSEFLLKIPATQQVALNFYTYVAEDNTYIRTKDIQQEEPVQIYIYENNQRIVAQAEFFYQTYMLFQGQANAIYMIRVINKGKAKLISMNTKKLLENSHIDDTLSNAQGDAHVTRTQNLAIQVNRWYQQFRKLMLLDFQDLRKVQGHIRKYWSYELIETIVAVGLCAVQIKMIQKLLKGNSIV